MLNLLKTLKKSWNKIVAMVLSLLHIPAVAHHQLMKFQSSTPRCQCDCEMVVPVGASAEDCGHRLLVVRLGKREPL